MRTSAAALLSGLCVVLSGAGCDGTVDACADSADTCISAHVDSEIEPLDQLAIVVTGLGARTTPTPAATLSFPVRFKIELPATTTNPVELRIDGSRNGVVLASASRTVALGANRRGRVDLTLRSNGGSNDLAASTDLDASGPPDLATPPTDLPTDASSSGDLAAPPFDLNGSVRLNVFAFGINGGTGQITVNNGQSCGTGCWLLPPASSVTVQAAAAAGSHLIAVSGDCPFDRTGAPCTLTMSIERTVLVSFESDAAPVNRVFVTPSAYSISTLAGTSLDDECKTFAMAFDATLASNYKAVYARNGLTLDDQLGTHRGWTRVDGLPFVDRIADLTAGKIQYPILLTSEGSASRATSDVFTGFDPDGTIGNDCVGWTNVADTVTLGRPSGGMNAWTANTDGFPRCGQSYPIYCFSKSFANEMSVTVTGPPRRSAFVITDGTGKKGNFGLNAADNACATTASGALLSGTYRAFLNTTAAGGGLARFDTTRGPWTRRDGTLLVTRASAFNPFGAPLGMNGTQGMLATFDKDELGMPTSTLNYIWFGGAAGTCEDWSSMSSSLFANGLFPVSISSAMPQLPCSAGATFLCLED